MRLSGTAEVQSPEEGIGVLLEAGWLWHHTWLPVGSHIRLHGYTLFLLIFLNFVCFDASGLCFIES